MTMQMQGIRMGKIECPSCGNEYVSLGGHLAKGSSCDYPEPTERQDSIIRGMLLGDGWINHHHDSANPYFAVGMTNREFLNWLNSEMQPFTTGVKDATGSDWSQRDYYKIRTIRAPGFERYLEWYPDGEYQRVDVDPDPLLLKMWYVSDGTLDQRDGRSPYITISTHQDGDREAYFEMLFSDIDTYPSRDNGKNIGFTVEGTKTFFEYIGDAPPGFEHKWPGGGSK